MDSFTGFQQWPRRKPNTPSRKNFIRSKRKPSSKADLKKKTSGVLTTKKPKLFQDSVRRGNNSVSSFYHSAGHLPPVIQKLVNQGLAKNFYAYNVGTRTSSSAGRQNLLSFGVFDRTDLETLVGKITSDKTAKFIALNCSYETAITNQSQVNARIWIYDIIPKRDKSGTASTYVYPDLVMENSFNNQGGSASDYLIPGVLPFSSDQWTQQYEVKKVTNFIMEPGSCHLHTCRFSPNKVVNRMIYENDATYGMYKGITAFQMIMYHGFPDNDSTTKTAVTVAPVALDIVWKKEYRYSYIVDEDATFSATQNLPVSYAVGESVVNEESGNIITPAFA